MTLLPVAAAAALTPLGNAAGAAASTVATGFLEMLKASVKCGAEAVGAAVSSTGDATKATSEVATQAAGELGQALSPAELRSRLGNLLQAFRDTVDQTLSDNGLPFDQGIRLDQSADGTFAVDSQNPRHVAAAEALNSTPVLKDLFAAIAHSMRQLQAAESAGGAAAPDTTGRLGILVSPGGATTL